MIVRRFVTLLMIGFLTWNSSVARPAVLGVVVEAKRVHVNSVAVTAGATVYDGDGFSTEAGGALFLRGEAAMLQLSAESAVIVRSKGNGAPGTEAELSKGTLAFSAARGSAVEMVMLGARICPVGDARTVAQVSVTGPKELKIYVRRGSIQFSYRGETETIAEGKSYRVILDPPSSESEKDKKKPTNDPKKKALLLVVIGEGAAVVALGIHELLEPESPERP